MSSPAASPATFMRFPNNVHCLYHARQKTAWSYFRNNFVKLPCILTISDMRRYVNKYATKSQIYLGVCSRNCQNTTEFGKVIAKIKQFCCLFFLLYHRTVNKHFTLSVPVPPQIGTSGDIGVNIVVDTCSQCMM